LKTLGQNLFDVVRGTQDEDSSLSSSGLLDAFWERGFTASGAIAQLTAIIAQLTHQHGRLNILEVGE
jgi:hypothetical protein